MKFKFLFPLLLVSFSSFCQGTFERYFMSTSDSSYFTLDEIQPTSDGGYITTGSFSDSLIIASAYLLKLDSTGLPQWIRSYDYHHCGSQGYDVIQTHDKGYFLAAAGIYNGSQDILMIRVDSVGDTLWTKMVGGSLMGFPAEVIQTNDHEFVVAATTLNFGSGHSDLMLFKIDTAGNMEWCRYVGTLDTLSGITNDEESFSVLQTPSGGYLLTGFVYLQQKALLVEIDSTGNVIWRKSFFADQKFQSVTSTFDGYLFTSASAMIKTDFTGNIQWNRSYYFWPQEVFQTSSGDFIWTDARGIV